MHWNAHSELTWFQSISKCGTIYDAPGPLWQFEIDIDIEQDAQQASSFLHLALAEKNCNIKQ